MFTNLKEIYRTLLDGERIWHPTHAPRYIQLTDDGLVDYRGTEVSFQFLEPSEWHRFESSILNLGPEHVGKKAKLRDGSVIVITSFYKNERFPVRGGDMKFKSMGRCNDEIIDQPRDIIRILD